MTRAGWIGLGLGLAVMLGLGCGSSSAFQCQTDAECGADGTCQAVGYCSFPDDECPGDQRYGEHAGDGLAGTCVGADGTSSIGSDETSDGGDDTTSGPEDPCGDDAECVPLAPPGWEGPVLAVLGTGTAPPCPAGAPEQLYVASAGLSADPARCACGCESPGGPEGSPCDVTAYASLGAECSEDVALPIDAGECVPLDVSLALPGTTVVVPAAGGSCEASSSSEIPPPQWTDQVRVCAGPLAGCGEGTCAPVGMTGDGVCIVREGEHTCPLSGYTQSFTFHRSVDDTRQCSECGCGGGVECLLEVYGDDTCSGVSIYQATLESDLCESVDNIIPNGQRELLGALIEETSQCSPHGGSRAAPPSRPSRSRSAVGPEGLPLGRGDHTPRNPGLHPTRALRSKTEAGRDAVALSKSGLGRNSSQEAPVCILLDVA